MDTPLRFVSIAKSVMKNPLNKSSPYLTLHIVLNAAVETFILRILPVFGSRTFFTIKLGLYIRFVAFIA